MKTRLYPVLTRIFFLLSLCLLLSACGTAAQETFRGSDARSESQGNALVPDSRESAAVSESRGNALGSDSRENAAVSESRGNALVPDSRESAAVSETTSGSDSASSELQVHFIDVGQGDSTLILCGGEAMLIDAGDNGKGTAIQLYLQKQGVEALTYVIGTHPDSDHIGGLDVILTKFDCGAVIMPQIASDTAAYRDVIGALTYRNYQITPPLAGDSYRLGEAVFTIVAPNGEYADDNNSSVGIRLVHGNNSFLFTGDAETEAETDMLQSGIDIKADVLHTGHHGSASSSSRDFIDRVAPAYAVISCGRDNPYGHPHEQTLDTLREYDVQVFRTDEQGSIVAVSDGSSITWNREPSQTWSAGTRAESDTASPADTPAPLPGPDTIIPGDSAVTYVLNHNTHKFHEPGCSSVPDIKESNREDTSLSREEILEVGYVPCKICNP